MTIKMFLKTSSEKMRLGFMGTTKQNDNHCYGRALIQHATKGMASALESGNKDPPIFFTVTALFISLLQQNRWTIKPIIWEFWDMCRM
jgi:hypothetical protein